jgi:hypothetical protein
MGVGSQKVERHAIANVSMPNEMVENEQVKAHKGKNLAQEFDVSIAVNGLVNPKIKAMVSRLTAQFQE